MIDKSQCFELGTIVKAIGKEGILLLIIDSDQPKNYAKLESMFVELNQTLVPFFIRQISINTQGEARVKVEGVDNEIEAQLLLGCSVFLPFELLKPLSGKRFYYHEIIGFEAIDSETGSFGVIKDVFENTSQAVIQVITPDNKEVFVPAVDEFIQIIDRKNKTFTFKLPDGLLELYRNV